MNARLARLATAVERLSGRERVLLLLALLAVTYALTQVLFLGPLERHESHLGLAVTHTRHELARLDRAEALLARSAALHPNVRLRRTLAHLRAERRAIDHRLEARTSGLIPARLMPHVLEQLLGTEPSLAVIALKTPPVRPLLTQGPGAPPPPAPGVRRPAVPVREALYVHTLALTFTGHYGATLTYLRAIEHLPWRFYWDRLSLHMRRYPVVRVRLVVHTLGLHRVLFAP